MEHKVQRFSYKLNKCLWTTHWKHVRQLTNTWRRQNTHPDTDETTHTAQIRAQGSVRYSVLSNLLFSRGQFQDREDDVLKVTEGGWGILQFLHRGEKSDHPQHREEKVEAARVQVRNANQYWCCFRHGAFPSWACWFKLYLQALLALLSLGNRYNCSVPSYCH